MKKIVLVVIAAYALVVWTSLASAQVKVGATSAKFLSIDVGARSAGMGSAFTAVTDMGAASVFWNPGIMTYTEGSGAYFNHTTWIADISYEAIGLVHTLKDIGSIGVGVLFLNSGNIDKAVESGLTGDTYTFSDMAAGVSYARRFTDRFSVGGTVKLVSEKVDDVTANTFAIDVGTIYEIGARGFKLAAAMKNLGPNLKYSKETGLDWPLPVNMRVGVIGEPVKLPMGKLLTGAEVIKSRDYTEIYAVGAEYWLNDYIALRGGYKINYSNNEQEKFNGGVGLKWGQGNLKVCFDYAYTGNKDLDAVHRVGVGVGF